MRKKLLITLSILAVAVMAAYFWPTPGYDINRVHPRLRELVTPYQSADNFYYLDGGSIGMIIVDRDGRKLELALPVNTARTIPDFPQLFLGATDSSKPGAVEVEFTKDTRRMLISIMEKYPQPPEDGGASLEQMRRSPRDYIKMGINVFNNLLR